MSPSSPLRGISIVGLGKLGASMAGCYAHKGFRVIGVDTNPNTVAAVNAGQAPVSEPGLAELIATNRERLSATHDMGDAVLASDITFIVVPTPSRDDGAFSLDAVLAAGSAVGKALRDKSEYHLVCLTSTVLPGGTGVDLLEVLERESGKRVGDQLGLCYSPEFIALGQVVHGLLNPDFLLIGESDAPSGELLSSFYQSVTDNQAPAVRMNLMNAELTKVAVNTYVTMKITFANMISALCEQLPGGDVDVVTGAIGRDSRIGSKYLRGAVGYGGPCFPRDNLALVHLARKLGREATLAEATDSYNRSVLARFVEDVSRAAGSQKRVAILGLAYKPDTNVVEESPGLLLAEALVKRRSEVLVYDPLAMEAARSRLSDTVRYASSADEAAGAADVVAVMNPDPEFKTPAVCSELARPDVWVFDGWRLFRDKPDIAGKATYQPSGVNLLDHTYGSEQAPSLATHHAGETGAE
ncbi:MAG TPA: nucleotide sugar dehydrogenase [Candidatus Solibacter sp.]|nr:nucleotide sugar dehydrogenase [Candidatus Solibacter sp.]